MLGSPFLLPRGRATRKERLTEFISAQQPRLGQPARRRRNVDGPVQVLLPRVRRGFRVPRDGAPGCLRPPARLDDA